MKKIFILIITVISLSACVSSINTNSHQGYAYSNRSIYHPSYIQTYYKPWRRNTISHRQPPHPYYRRSLEPRYHHLR